MRKIIVLLPVEILKLTADVILRYDLSGDLYQKITGWMFALMEWAKK